VLSNADRFEQVTAMIVPVCLLSSYPRICQRVTGFMGSQASSARPAPKDSAFIQLYLGQAHQPGHLSRDAGETPENRGGPAAGQRFSQLGQVGTEISE
jgi:hypothetical protein